MVFPVIEVRNGVVSVRKAVRSDIVEIVYALIQLIPIGCIATYGDIARILGVSPRYIARILKENKNIIAIPCHRVVRSGGRIGGYTINGKRVDHFKERLLMLESLGKTPCKAKINF